MPLGLDAVEFGRYCLGPRDTSDGYCENGWSHRFAAAYFLCAFFLWTEFGV